MPKTETPKTPQSGPSVEELLACPFCGSPCNHQRVWEGGPPEKLCDYYSCSNRGCPASPVTTTATEWNTRTLPAEQAVGARDAIQSAIDLAQRIEMEIDTKGIGFVASDDLEFTQWLTNAITAYGQACAQGALEKQWHPIETAPRDGRYSIFYSDTRGVRLDRASKANPNGELFYDQRPGENYTHWMPLPEPPTLMKEG